MRIRLTHTVAVVAALGLLGTAGAASAQGGGNSSPMNASAQGAPGGGRAVFGGAALMDTAAGYLGLSKDQLLERVRGGQTLAQIAVAQGKSVDGLVDTMVAAARQQLDRLVADGKLTAAQGNQIAGQLEARITEMVNNGPSASGAGGAKGSYGAALLDTAAQYLGLSTDQVLARVRGGQTLAQIAVAQGKSVDGLVDTMVAAAKAQLDQKVAEGKLTAAQRDQIAAQLEAGITALVTNGNTPFGAGGPSGSGRPSGVPGPSGFGRPSGVAGPSGSAFHAPMF
jgi:hypothetical protein